MNFRISFLLVALCFFKIDSVEALDVQDYRFTNSYRYSILEDTSSERFKGKNTFTASYAHVSSPFYLINTVNNTLYQEIVKSYDMITLGGSYRYGPKLQFMVDTAVIKAKILNEEETAIGDTHLKAKYLIFGNKRHAFSFIPELVLSTGSEIAFTTRSGLGLVLRGTYEHHVGRLHFLGSLGYDSGSQNTFYNIDNTQLILTELGFSLDLIKNWNVNFEMTSTYNLNTLANQSKREGDYYITFKNRTSLDFSTYAGLGIASLSAPDKMNKTFFLGLKYNFDNFKIAEKTRVESETNEVDLDLNSSQL